MGMPVALMSGRFFVLHQDCSKNIVGHYSIDNGVTYQGANECLKRTFTGGTQTQWYIGLIDNAGFTSVSINDTNALHPGWVEHVQYSGERKLWDNNPAASCLVTTNIPVVMAITAAGAVRGTFLASRSQRDNNAAGVIYCTATINQTAGFAVAVGDTLTVTYVTRITRDRNDQ